MNAFWQIGSERTRLDDSLSSDKKELSVQEAEDILTELARTYSKDEGDLFGPLHHFVERLDRTAPAESSPQSLMFSHHGTWRRQTVLGISQWISHAARHDQTSPDLGESSPRRSNAQGDW